MANRKEYWKIYSKKYYQAHKKEKKKYKQKHKEKIKKQHKKWLKEHLWYNHYSGAKQRCNNPKNKDYKRYGDRGIKFCMTPNDFKILWFRDKAYLMKRPSIDRKNNDGNYTLKNCQFIELSKNVSKDNKGKKHSKLTKKQVIKIRKLYKIKIYSQIELARRFKVCYNTIYYITKYKTWTHI